MPESTCPDCGLPVIWAKYGLGRIKLDPADAAPDRKGAFILIRMSGALHALSSTQAADRLVAVDRFTRDQAIGTLSREYVGHMPHRCEP